MGQPAVAQQPNTRHSPGADLRAPRKARGLTLAELTGRLNRFVGWLGQVERDLSEPSVTDLRYLAAQLDVPVSMLFDHAPANPGDSFRIRGERFRWINPYDEPAVAIWVIAPPVY